MKTIFILLTSGFSARNIIATDVFRKLKEQPNLRLVFIVSPGTKKDFVEIEVPERIIFEEYERPSILPRKLGHFCFLNSFSQPTTWKLNTDTILIRREQLKKRRPFYYAIFRVASFVVSFDWFRNLLRAVDWAIFPKRNVVALFDKYKPDLLFSTDPLFFDEVYYIEYAKKIGIKNISFIMSWDNLTSRGILPVLTERMIVWNEVVKNELIEIYGFNPKNIFISGIPQFDVYFHDNLVPSREEFFKSVGADTDKKLIVYTTGSPSLLPGECSVIDMFCEDYLSGKVKGDNTQLLIRLNPRDSIGRYSNLVGKPNIIFDKPGRPNRSFRDLWNPSYEDVRHLAATLKYADVLLNMCSTISIESAIFDTPTINVNIDPAMRSYYRYTHYARIVRTGGVKLVETREGLIYAINGYLENPGEDRAGRQKIVNEQCCFTDGRAGERIAGFLFDYLDEPGLQK